MKKEIIKGLGDMVGDMAKGACGKSGAKKGNSGDMVEILSGAVEAMRPATGKNRFK